MLILGLVLLGGFLGVMYARAYDIHRRTDLKADGCPSGLYNYGVPLGCVPKSTIDRCQSETCPICLSNLTEIEVQHGRQVVTSLRNGEMVWSMDDQGRKILVPIIRIVARPVPINTHLLQITLADGRSLFVSPNHPTADGKKFTQLIVGDKLDGSTVTVVNVKAYSAGFTYDILPKSSTGQYWANGVLVGSTLK